MRIWMLVLGMFVFCCKGQTLPLNTHFDNLPLNAYIKDLNNELISYEGTWKGTWDNKTLFVMFKKVKKYMDHRENNPYYKDVLTGKFKVLDSSGNILYDNTSLSDQDTKIEGARFLSIPYRRYTLFYIDADICSISGDIFISFVNTTNTQLNWNFMDTTDLIDSSCQYYNSNPFPQPLPKSIILTKQ